MVFFALKKRIIIIFSNLMITSHKLPFSSEISFVWRWWKPYSSYCTNFFLKDQWGCCELLKIYAILIDEGLGARCSSDIMRKLKRDTGAERFWTPFLTILRYTRRITCLSLSNGAIIVHNIFLLEFGLWLPASVYQSWTQVKFLFAGGDMKKNDDL